MLFKQKKNVQNKTRPTFVMEYPLEFYLEYYQFPPTEIQ